MSEMVERVAKRLGDGLYGYVDPKDTPRTWATAVSLARDAIEEMREPICAAIHCGCSNYCDFDEAEAKLRGLFDAALRPKD